MYTQIDLHAGAGATASSAAAAACQHHTTPHHARPAGLEISRQRDQILTALCQQWLLVHALFMSYADECTATVLLND